MIARPVARTTRTPLDRPAATRADARVAEWIVDLDEVLRDLLPARDALPALAEVVDLEDACGCSGGGMPGCAAGKAAP